MRLCLLSTVICDYVKETVNRDCFFKRFHRLLWYLGNLYFYCIDDSVGDGKHLAYTGSQTLMKTRSKTKAAAVPVYPIHLERTINNMKGIPMQPRYPLMENTINMEPLSGVKFNNKKKAVLGSSLTDLSKKYEEKMVATPINYGALKKKDEGNSSMRLLRSRSNRCFSLAHIQMKFNQNLLFLF